MISKIIFITISVVSLFVLVVGIRLLANRKLYYANDLRRLMISAATAVFAYTHIAMASRDLAAEVAFCVYFASIDWIAYFLMRFCLNYTRHKKVDKILKYPVFTLVLLDTTSIFLNLVLNHEFEVYRLYDSAGEVFYQYTYSWPYYIHLGFDYVTIAIGFVMIIIALIKNYSFYRVKYVIIFTIISSLILINLGYMAFALPLDWSVVLYAFASMLIYYYAIYYVPSNLIVNELSMAANEMSEGLLLFDIENNCVYINDFVRYYFDIKSPEECLIDHLPVQIILDDGNLNSTEEEIHQIIVPGKDGRRDERFRIHFKEMFDSNKHKLGTFFRIERITDEYNNMIELQEARKAADDASVAKSLFLASMSHEIRTPINAVLGMNEMVLRESQDEQILEYAQNIKSAGNALLGLINDILDFSKVEAGRMDLISATYDLHDILRDAYHMLSSRATGKGLKFDVSCTDDIPAGLYGDEQRIRQILTNVVTNAIKYTVEGSVTVDVSCEPIDEDNVTLILKVSDTGIGIAEEDRAKLFDAFSRFDSNRNKNVEGTGLGLAITQQLLALMGGSVNVESTLGKGSVFTLLIPQKVTDKKTLGKFRHTKEVQKDSYRESFTAPEAQVLVVDDVPMNVKVVKALLKKTGVKLDTATGGVEAFEMCKQKKYDIILMDHMMPVVDGIEALHMIQNEGINRDSKVIVLTANAINGVQKEYEEAGFDDYLSKPVRGEELEAMLVKYLPENKVVRQ